MKTINKPKDMKGTVPTVLSLQAATARDPYQCHCCEDGSPPPWSVSETMNHQSIHIRVVNLETPMPASPRDSSGGTDSSEPPVPSRTRRILVADDDEGIRHLISTVLARAGFDVNAAANGQQAWEALLHEHYDLLVTDNEMPQLAGMELIERIREAGMSLPVILASGTLSVERGRDYPPRPIAAVFPKPFDIFELLNAVRHVLQAPCGDTTTDQGTFHQLHATPQPIR